MCVEQRWAPLLRWRRFSTAGHPGPGRLFVFDGDLVDRGAWGLEVLLLVAAWKVAAPAHVFLVRLLRLHAAGSAARGWLQCSTALHLSLCHVQP